MRHVRLRTLYVSTAPDRETFVQLQDGESVALVTTTVDARGRRAYEVTTVLDVRPGDQYVPEVHAGRLRRAWWRVRQALPIP